MANRSVEILLKAADQFSDPTKKAELQLAALKVQAENLNKSFDKLSKQNPSLSVDEARAAAVALENMSGSAKHAAGNLNQSKDAAQGLANMVGIQLPQAATQFLAHSSAIGPALSAAFTTVGVIALLEAVMKLPEAFEKIKGSITGWTETARKAYDDLIDSNNKARLAVLDLDLAFNQAFGKDSADSLKLVDDELSKVLKTIVALQEEAKGTDIITGGGEVVNIPSERSGEEIQAAINRQIVLQNELTKKKNDLQKQGALDEIKDRREMIDWMVRTDAAAAEFQKNQSDRRKKDLEELLAFEQQAGDEVIKRQQEFNNRTFAGGEEVKAGLAENDRLAKLIIKDYQDMNALLQQAGDELIKNNQYWDEQLQKFRNQTPDDVKAGEDAGRERAKQIIDNFKKQREAGLKIIDQFSDDISRMFTNSIANGKGFWQAFKDQGKNTIAALADTFLSTMIKGFLDPFAAKLGKLVLGPVSGGGVGGSGTSGAAGGILGGISAKSLAAFATNPFTIAAAAGIIGTTAWLKSQAHHEASTFVKKFQDPFGQDLDRILHSSESAANKLKDVESAWTDFSQAAQQFARGGSDEALVVKQAFDTLNPLIANIRSDLGRTAANIQAVTPSGPTTVYLQIDGKTMAKLVIPSLYALSRNQGFQLAGAR